MGEKSTDRCQMLKLSRFNSLRWLTVVFAWLALSHAFIGNVWAEPDSERQAKKVLILGVDGVRPDALAKAKTPHVDELIRHGAFTDTATILGERYRENNTISGPGWSSILTGVWADKHGVHDNSFRGKNYEQFPHFFKRLKSFRPDGQTVSLVSWAPIDEHIVSDAEIRRVEPLPGRAPRTVDLNISGEQVGVDTRDGRWHHLLARRNEGTVELYLDGKLAGTADDTAGEFELEGDFYFIGRDTRSGSTRFQGQLNEVRLWNRALTPQEIGLLARGIVPTSKGDRPDSVRSDGLLARYAFETTRGRRVRNGQRAVGVVDDSAGHPEGPFHASGVAEGQPPTYLAGPLPGVAQRGGSRHAFHLPQDGGSAQGARIDLNEPLRQITTGEFTIEAWFRTTNSGRNVLMGNYASNTGALNLELHTDNRVRVYVQPIKTEQTDVLQAEDQRDLIMAENASRILREGDPDAMFVYFHQVDATGHRIGFSPDVPEYVGAIEKVDTYIGQVLEAMRSRPNFAQEDWLVIVCTDHGGIDRTHSNGHEIPEILTVFLIVSGPSAQVGRIEQQAFLVDVAVTALVHLGIPLDPQWQLDGRPVGLKSAGQ